jgi:hypothetical protein
MAHNLSQNWWSTADTIAAGEGRPSLVRRTGLLERAEQQASDWRCLERSCLFGME